LDNFPVFSRKKWKNPLFQIIFSKFLCPHLDFKFLSFAQKRHYIY
jgi:hypothetical protein